MRPNVIVLPPAGREEQLERWGITPDRTGVRVHGAHADDAEARGYDDGHELDESEGQSLGFLLDGGWHAVEPAKGTVRGEGTTSHRGVLQDDEHVDTDALRVAVEAELGFTFDEVRSVYRKGRMTDAQLGLRARIDARLLEVATSGGRMIELARAFGWTIKAASSSGGQSCDTMERALARARKEHA